MIPLTPENQEAAGKRALSHLEEAMHEQLETFIQMSSYMADTATSSEKAEFNARLECEPELAVEWAEFQARISDSKADGNWDRLSEAIDVAFAKALESPKASDPTSALDKERSPDKAILIKLLMLARESIKEWTEIPWLEEFALWKTQSLHAGKADEGETFWRKARFALPQLGVFLSVTSESAEEKCSFFVTDAKGAISQALDGYYIASPNLAGAVCIEESRAIVPIKDVTGGIAVLTIEGTPVKMMQASLS